MRGGAKAPAAAPAGAPPAVDDKDAPRILNQELRKARSQLSAARTDDERRRAQTDVDGVLAEMKRRGFAEEPGMMTTSAPAPAAAPRPAPPAAAPKPAPTAAAPAAPAAAASTSQIDFAAASPDAAQPAAPTAARGPAAAPAGDQLLAALNPSGNEGLAGIAGRNAEAIRRAAAQLQEAEQAIRNVPPGDTQAFAQATRQQKVAKLRLNSLLADMEPGMAQKVRAAIGV
jgi:hypothetical protein